MASDGTLLEVKGLKTYFFLDQGLVKAVDGVDFDIARGETMCVVGESGCGKSITARSIMQIVDPPGRIVEGEMLFHLKVVEEDGSEAEDVIDLATLKPNGRTIRSIRGKEISMIFQEPMTSLSPVHTIGHQVSQAITLHNPVTKEQARQQTIETLRLVGIPKPELRIDAYPVPIERRHAPARHDRHGPRVPSQPADCRRADHGARCDDSGPNPRSDDRIAGGDGHGDDVHHP